MNLKKILKESLSKLVYNGVSYRLKIDANEDPTKQGIRIQLTPLNGEPVSEELSTQLQLRLNQKLGKIGLSVDIDGDVAYENTVGYLIRLIYFEKLIKDSFVDQTEST